MLELTGPRGSVPGVACRAELRAPGGLATVLGPWLGLNYSSPEAAETWLPPGLPEYCGAFLGSQAPAAPWVQRWRCLGQRAPGSVFWLAPSVRGPRQPAGGSEGGGEVCPPLLLPRKQLCFPEHVLQNPRSAYYSSKVGWASAQVGLGGIQAQPLYNLRDLGHPHASWNPVSLSV